MVASLGITPPKMSLTNINTTETVEAMFNPTELQESLKAEYTRLKPVGLSHEVLQYANTANTTFAVNLFMRAADPKGSVTAKNRMLEFRKFIQSCLHPRKVTTILGGGPPRVLFVWPNLISLTCVITTATLSYTRFNAELEPVEMTIALALEELRDKFVSSETMRNQGTQRG